MEVEKNKQSKSNIKAEIQNLIIELGKNEVYKKVSNFNNENKTFKKNLETYKMI